MDATTRPADPAPPQIRRARLPRWCLPAAWPALDGEPACADLALHDGRIVSVVPHDPSATPGDTGWDVAGAPVLPGLVEAHTHIDKTFTLRRLGALRPGLLAAIETTAADRAGWTVDDVTLRATRSLEWAHRAGVVRLRTHCDWWQLAPPLAWDVLNRLARDWAGRIALDRVGLVTLPLFARRDDADAIARAVAAGGPGACLGAFVHTTNFDPVALRHLFEAAERHGLDVDLHCDEELNPQAQGLAATAELLRAMRFAGRVVCGHVCALAVQPDDLALATLDAVAAAPITLVSLPTTNLLLQDAVTGRTPRLRGITLVQEARARGIPLLISTDNVQDAFCRSGSYDPVEALSVATLAAQLDAPFDVWSESICRADWLARTPGEANAAMQPGAVADLVVFHAAEAPSWPACSLPRTVLRAGRAIAP